MSLIRDMRELHPAVIPVASEWLRRCASRLYPVLIVETRRTWEVQEAYFARGRKSIEDVNELYVRAGLPPITSDDNLRIITKAQPPRSFHFFGLAIDFVPFVDGKPDWIYDENNPRDFHDDIAKEAKNLGFEWGGDWRTFQDIPHIQFTGGWTIDDAVDWSMRNAHEWRIPIPKR